MSRADHSNARKSPDLAAVVARAQQATERANAAEDERRAVERDARLRAKPQLALPMPDAEHCPVTRKRIYTSKHAAREGMRNLKARLFVYECEHCRKWHLTNGEKRNRP